MDELIKLVVAKTGISTENAKGAIDTVLGFIKSKLPAPIAGQVESAISGGGLGDIAKNIGSMFGK